MLTGSPGQCVKDYQYMHKVFAHLNSVKLKSPVSLCIVPLACWFVGGCKSSKTTNTVLSGIRVHSKMQLDREQHRIRCPSFRLVLAADPDDATNK